MPDPDFQKYIYDGMEAINNLDSFTSNITLDKLEEVKFKRAVERGISIIGEALYMANKIKKDLAIIGMRHIVIHDYDIIEAERLYIPIKKYIPILKEEISKYLD